MFKKSSPFLLAICALLLSHAASAATYSFDYSYDGSAVTQNVSAAGSSVVVGDNVVATYHAAGNGYWHAPADTMIWTPQEMIEAGDRVGDLSWTFLFNGVAVDSGSSTGQSSQSVHIPQPAFTSRDINFDTLTWTYVLTSSTAPGNTLDGGDFGLSSLSGASYVAMPVPEPETYAMVLCGLGLVGAIARRRRQA